MIDQKKSKYVMKFTLFHNMEKVEWFQKVIDCLSVLEDYLPQKISMDGYPYDNFNEAVLFKYIREKRPLSVRLKRDRKLKYELILEAKGLYCKSLKLEWKETMNEKKWEEYVSLCETLIAAFQPDFAYISRRYIIIPPHTNRTEELLDMMNDSFLINSNYDEYGPGGLGMVTNTDFKDLPESWCCPYCGAPKHTFITQKVQKKEAFEQADIYRRRGELYQKHGMLELAKADFDMVYRLNAKLISGNGKE